MSGQILIIWLLSATVAATNFLHCSLLSVMLQSVTHIKNRSYCIFGIEHYTSHWKTTSNRNPKCLMSDNRCDEPLHRQQVKDRVSVNAVICCPCSRCCWCGVSSHHPITVVLDFHRNVVLCFLEFF